MKKVSNTLIIRLEVQISHVFSDWNVLRLVLQELPKVLKNKTLILSKHGNIQLDLLVDVLSPSVSKNPITISSHIIQ